MGMLNAAGDPAHFAHPFTRAADGKVRLVAQDTLEHITSQVGVVVSYPGPDGDRPGYRPEKPSFGIPWPFGKAAPVDGAAIQAAVRLQVPAATLEWAEYAPVTVTSRVLEIDVEA